jgi:hypothetical protein
MSDRIALRSYGTSTLLAFQSHVRAIVKFFCIHATTPPNEIVMRKNENRRARR